MTDNNETTAWNGVMGGGCSQPDSNSWGRGFATGVIGIGVPAVVAGGLYEFSLAMTERELRAAKTIAQPAPSLPPGAVPRKRESGVKP